jgi:hypothetical protein
MHNISNLRIRRLKIMKKFLTIVFCIIVIAGIGLAILNILGRPVKVKVDKRVNGIPLELSNVLYYASLAPNSHNAQMWRISADIKNNQIKIYLDEKRTLKAVDSKDREAYISIGAYTANLLKAFEGYGYKTNCKITEDEKDKELVVVSYQKQHNALDKDILKVIVKRHTDKSGYLNKKISEETTEKLINKDANLSYYAGGTKKFEYIKTGTLEATKLQAYNNEKAAELSKWLRLSDKETTASKDGLSAEQLGITGIKKTIYYMITTHESAKGSTYAKQGIDTATNQLNNCSGFLVLTGESSRKNLIETGINLENVWLIAAQLGISVQPMSQILEEKPYCNEINGKLKISKPIQMVLRVGYAKEYGSNNQIRRDLSQYITVEK